MTEAVVKFFCAVFLTVFIKSTVLFRRWKGDKAYFTAVVAVNAAMNLTMNLILGLVMPKTVLCWILWLFPLEIAVICTEYLVL